MISIGWPTSDRVVVNGYYGPPSVAGQLRHAADDFAMPVGTPVHCVRDGMVTFAGWADNNTGWMIEITHQANGYLFKSRYLHLSQIQVVSTQAVVRGQQIALSGNTGLTTGPHLHFAVWFNSQAGALSIQPDPTQEYTVWWAVNPSLMYTEQEDEMTKLAKDTGGNWYAIQNGCRMFLGHKREDMSIDDQGEGVKNILVAIGVGEVITIDTPSLYAIPSFEEKLMLAVQEYAINPARVKALGRI